eukprot:TRINITY_DN722_c0_g1_i1.p1 TRINITY_DN722_c0_g1~~TRINITY_DN722_c0_g1_i1.p1  ORF type:complete len:334 (-),score=84.19 TRINITY_DN722_c0_g1_i1:96-1097(-)
MAKSGEGDARWIVTNRDDGKNVGNWHWTETDYTGWVSKKLIELLNNLALESSLMKATTNTVNTKGEVTINTRKGKVITLYELDVNMKWEGELLSNTGTTYKGTIALPYISEENDDDEFETQVTIEGDSKDHATMKDEVRKTVIPILKKKIPQMLQELRDVVGAALKMEKKNAPTPTLDKLETNVAAPPVKKEEPVKKAVTSSSSFTLKEKFVCPPSELFACFVDPNRVKAYSGSNSVMNGTEGGEFKLFDGTVTGINTKVEHPKLLVQKWRFESWPQGHYSQVTLSIEEKNGKSILTVKQDNIPAEDKERTERGWSHNFFNRIKGVFGYGGLL